MGKRENAGNQCLLPCQRDKSTFKLSSANAFNLDQSKILTSDRVKAESNIWLFDEEIMSCGKESSLIPFPNKPWSLPVFSICF